MMSTKLTLTLAVAAGFLGGIVSQHLTLTSVSAQEPTPAAKEIRAEKFVVVDENGSPRGAFGIDPRNGWATIEFTGENQQLRRVSWITGPGWTGKGKSSVVPER